MKWILYGDHKMDPLRRSQNGAYTPVGDTSRCFIGHGHPQVEFGSIPSNILGVWAAEGFHNPNHPRKAPSASWAMVSASINTCLL